MMNLIKWSDSCRWIGYFFSVVIFMVFQAMVVSSGHFLNNPDRQFVALPFIVNLAGWMVHCVFLAIVAWGAGLLFRYVLFHVGKFICNSDV
jgi:hypothetical protein